MKVVVNRGCGGFGLSPSAILRLYELAPELISATPVPEYFEAGCPGTVEASLSAFKKHIATDPADRKSRAFVETYSPDKSHILCVDDVDRSNSALVQVIEEMGAEANGPYALLAILEIPDGTDYQIHGHDDGVEHIAETHRTWS